jgi:GPH family glycoside/pentoside/hexuronide:cation symporter
VKTSATLVLALPMLLGGFVQFVVSQFYQKFATDTLLLDSAVIGAIFFASRATDAVLDPVCGYWSDRLRKRRIFIGVGLIALAGGLVIAFLPALDIFAASAVAKYSLAAIGIFTLYFGVTLVYIPHYAWLAALQRALPKLPFFASRVVTENIGTILGGVALAVLVPLQQKSTPMLFYAIVAMLMPLVLLGSVPVILQNDPGAVPDPSAHSFRRALAKLAENRRFALVAGMSFFNQFAATTLLAVSLYYTDYVLGNKELGVTLAVVFLLSATLFVPVWSLLARRYSRLKLWMIALTAIVVVFPTVLLTQAGHIWYLTVFAVLIGGFAGAVILFVPQEVAFTTGSKSAEEGLYFAAFTFVNKSAMACAPLVIGVALSAAGYVPVERTVAVSQTISFLFVAVPALAFFISAVLLRFYTRATRAAEPM